MKALEFQRSTGFYRIVSINGYTKEKLVNTLQMADSQEIIKLQSKAVHSVRKSCHGNGIDFYPGEAEDAALQAFEQFLMSPWKMHKYNIKRVLEKREPLPITAFLNSLARSNYWNQFRKAGMLNRVVESPHLANTDIDDARNRLQGNEKIDRLLSDVEFYATLETVNPCKLQIVADMLIKGYKYKEIGYRMGVSKMTVCNYVKELKSLYASGFNSW
jgi:DNA-directed RNA polymerase specialized sigma24 family protein